MKLFIVLAIFSIEIFAFNFGFGRPPAKEEVMEPSVLGDEVRVDKKEQSRSIDLEIKKEPDYSFDDRESSNSKTIYVEHKNSYEPTYLDDISYPKIALLVPRKVIKKYANSVADSILSYLIYKKGKFDLELFDCKDENPKNIVEKLNEIRSKGFSLVIAPMTQRGARWIAKYENRLIVYIPTVNKKEVPIDGDNIFFGGIDYEEQIDRLLTFAGDKIAIFNDKSALSAKISSFVKNAAFSDISYEMIIRSAKINLSPYLKNNHKLDKASIFLNMPIVKTSLLASQLGIYDIKYQNLLLTQIAYNPLIFTLTQPKDRQNMYIANSIGKSNFVLKDINLILGSNIDFAWVNYSAMLGMDYFFTHIIYNESKIFNESMNNNQIAYKIDILRPTISSFVKIDRKF